MIQTIIVALDVETQENLKDIDKEIISHAIDLLRKRKARTLDSNSKIVEFQSQYRLDYKCPTCGTQWRRNHRSFDQMEECPNCAHRNNKPFCSMPIKWREDARTGGMI